MNINYLKIIDNLIITKSDIEALLEEVVTSDVKRFVQEGREAEPRSFEDAAAYNIVENIIESLDKAIDRLKRYSLPTIEGKLIEDKERNKFELVRDNGKGLGWFFSCGDYLEVFNDGEWYSGNVEHTTRNDYTGYYFYNSDLQHPFLYEGMRVRIRKGE